MENRREYHDHIEDVVDDEFEKLLDVKFYFKVLVYYPDESVQQDHLRIFRKAIEVGNSQTDELHTFIMMHSNASQRDKWKKYTQLRINGFVLRKNENSHGLGDAEVLRTDTLPKLKSR